LNWSKEGRHCETGFNTSSKVINNTDKRHHRWTGQSVNAAAPTLKTYGFWSFIQNLIRRTRNREVDKKGSDKQMMPIASASELPDIPDVDFRCETWRSAGWTDAALNHELDPINEATCSEPSWYDAQFSVNDVWSVLPWPDTINASNISKP
jgi:hypothetical protein